MATNILIPLGSEPSYASYTYWSPFNVYYEDNIWQFIILEEELLATGITPGSNLLGVSFKIGNILPDMDISNFRLRVQTTQLNNFPSTSFIQDGWTLLSNISNIPVSSFEINSLFYIEFLFPYEYNGGNLLIETSRDLDSYSGQYAEMYFFDLDTNTRSLFRNSDGESFPLYNSYPTGFVTTKIPELTFLVELNHSDLSIEGSWNTLPPYQINNISSYENSFITWKEEIESDGILNVKICVSDNNTIIPEDNLFIEINKNQEIPNLVLGENLINKYIWIKIYEHRNIDYVSPTIGDFSILINYTPIEEINIIGDNILYGIEDSIQLDISFIPSNATYKQIIWNSEDSNYITVDNNGLVRGLLQGTCNIIATTVEGNIIDTYPITMVGSPVLGIHIKEPERFIFNNNETIQLEIEFVPNSPFNTNVTWASDNSVLASVNSSGLVTFTSNTTPGNVIISVTSEDGNFIDQIEFEKIASYDDYLIDIQVDKDFMDITYDSMDNILRVDLIYEGPCVNHEMEISFKENNCDIHYNLIEFTYDYHIYIIYGLKNGTGIISFKSGAKVEKDVFINVYNLPVPVIKHEIINNFFDFTYQIKNDYSYYSIKYIEELFYLNYLIKNRYSDGIEGKERIFVLENDLDFNNDKCYLNLENKQLFTSGEGWKPLDPINVGDIYTGYNINSLDSLNLPKFYLHGNYYSIKNLYINRPNEDGLGLFRFIEIGVIFALNFENVNIIGRDNIGIVSGYHNHKEFFLYPSYFQNINIQGRDSLGGLIGYGYPILVYGQMNNLYSTGERYYTTRFIIKNFIITGRDYIGGIIGYSFDCFLGESTNLIISQFTINGSNNLGGVIGFLNSPLDQSLSDSIFIRGTIIGDGENIGGCIGYSKYIAYFTSYRISIIIDLVGSNSVGGFIGRCDSDISTSSDTNYRRVDILGGSITNINNTETLDISSFNRIIGKIDSPGTFFSRYRLSASTSFKFNNISHIIDTTNIMKDGQDLPYNIQFDSSIVKNIEDFIYHPNYFNGSCFFFEEVINHKRCIGGSGLKEDPYLINCIDNLMSLHNGDYKLIKNLDFNDINSYEDPNLYILYTTRHVLRFKLLLRESFNGNYKTISNLNHLSTLNNNSYYCGLCQIYKYDASASYNMTNFLGYYFSNLNMINLSSDTTTYNIEANNFEFIHIPAPIKDAMSPIYFKNIHINGYTINHKGTIGGFLQTIEGIRNWGWDPIIESSGYYESPAFATFSNCSIINANFTSDNTGCSGGFIGTMFFATGGGGPLYDKTMYNAIKPPILFERCRFEGEINNNVQIGGFIGNLNFRKPLDYDFKLMKDCYVIGKINNNNNTSSEDTYFGGLIGVLTQCNFNQIIENCYSYIQFQMKDPGYWYFNITLEGCTIGGFIGLNQNNITTINNCFSLSNYYSCIYNRDYEHLYEKLNQFGTFIGNTGGTVNYNNCFELDTIQTLHITNLAHQGTPITLTQARLKETYSNLGWLIDNIWFLSQFINNGFPSFDYNKVLKTIESIHVITDEGLKLVTAAYIITNTGLKQIDTEYLIGIE